MITRCEFCHFIVIAEEGCANCYTGKYSPNEKEVHRQENIENSHKVETPAEDYMQAPAGQLSLMF